MPRKKKLEEFPAQAPAYMGLYSTLMTLLMAFFVVLCTMGTYGGQKFDAAATSLNKWFTVLPSGGFGMLSQKSASVGRVAPHFKMGKPKVTVTLGGTEIESVLKSTVEDGVQDIEVTYFKDGSILIKVPDNIFFDRGSVVLRKKAHRFLMQIIILLSDQPFVVKVRGHTDDTYEPGALYTSNWELSSLRAVNIIRYLHDKGHVPYTQLINEGFSSYRPISSDPNEKGKNRRIEFLLEKIEDQV